MGALRRAVVVHAGRRDQYQVALALQEGGLLERLVTDIYFPLDQPWFLRTVGRLFSAAWLRKRYCNGLPSAKVRCAVPALAVIAAQRLLPAANLYPLSDALLGRMAARLARRAGAAVFSYSTYAAEALAGTRAGERPKLLFQMHPHPASARRVLEEELRQTPLAATSLLREYELSISPRAYRRLVREPELADAIVVASRFCAHTLAENGIPTQRVYVVPYGVDTASFPEKPLGWRPGDRLKLVFLGSIIQRKGVSYLLEAMRRVQGRPVELVLCGRVAPDRRLLMGYEGLPITVRLGLAHEQVVRELHAADLFVFPSLLEGFGQVILEAMACGLPVITTPHTCGPDVLVEGEHGFVVPIRDSAALADRILWALDHRERLAEMGRQAAMRAREFTWERFREGIRCAYRAACRGGQGGG